MNGNEYDFIELVDVLRWYWHPAFFMMLLKCLMGMG